MKKTLTLLLVLIPLFIFAQKIRIDSTAYMIHHNDLTLYLDSDSASYLSVQVVTHTNMLKIDGVRSEKWHKEIPYGPYKKDDYIHTGYDLGHLTPSNITSYNDSLNYHSFSLFNQAPQIAAFNRGSWAQLEGKVETMILKQKGKVTIITGVLYDNKNKEYLRNSKIKIPFVYYKIVVFKDTSIKAWIGSNSNGLITETDIKTILDIAIKNGDKLNIVISK